MQNSESRSSSIYDNLSIIMKILKQSLLLLQKLIVESTRQLPFEKTVSQLNQRKAQLFSIAQQMLQKEQSVAKQEKTILCKVFPRFIGRLKQIISLHQHQYSQSIAFNPIKPLLKEISQSVSGFQNDKELPRLLRRVGMMVDKYTDNIPMKIQSVQGKIVQQNSSFEMIGTNALVKKTEKNQESSQPNIMKILQIINKRFALHVGMDLEFSYFRSILFQSKNKVNSLYENCMAGNKWNQIQIDNYANAHSQYLRKKPYGRLKNLNKLAQRVKTQAVGRSLLGMKNEEHKLRTQSSAESLFALKIKNMNAENGLFNPEGRIIVESALINIRQVQNLGKRHRDYSRPKKNPLEMKSLVMTGNYFDQVQEEASTINPKNSVYVNKKPYAFLSRPFQSPQKTFLRTLKHKNSLTPAV